MSKNIVLVGLSGSGKTTIGKLLEQKINLKFIDTDEIIVNNENRSINDIFATDGEKFFRQIEFEVVRKVSEQNDLIISTGGGVVLNQENIDNLKKNGIVFYLKTSVDTLINRLKNDTTRPLLKTNDLRLKLEKMLLDRATFYEKADYIIKNDNDNIEQTVENILRSYNERS